jgi:hypothetical protein
VDVPASFYVALTALGAWRWLNSHAWRDALLTGISAGLAMWTKSDALTLLVSLVALGLLAAFIQARNRSERPSPQALWMQAILMAGAILAVAGPWYARNLAELGFLLPNTAWTYLAPHDMASLLVMVRNPQDFRGSGWLFAGSLVYGGARVVFTGFRRMSPWTVLLAIVLPFFAAWWWLASYDVRFLVTIVPLLSVVGALMLHETAEMLATRMAPNWQRGATWVGALLVLATAPFALQRAVDSKGAIVQNPLMSDADKHRVRLGGLYDLALAINALPAGSRVLGVPPLAVYHIDWARLPAISDTAPDMPPWNYSQTYDYVAYDFQGKENPGWSYSAVPILNTFDGYYLYATHTINPPAADGS